MKTSRLFLGVLFAALALQGAGADEKNALNIVAGGNSDAAIDKVQPVPTNLRQQFSLSPFYTRCVIVDGFPIVASDQPSDAAMLEAAWLIRKMLKERKDILKALTSRRTRFTVMSVDELTTDVPEHSDLTPKDYWNRRARGLGATRVRPSVSCGEENLIGHPGDPYSTENILIHEFAHAIHEMALNHIDPKFDARLETIYKAAMDAGLWKDVYAATNHREYWAEGVQSYFDTNRAPDHDHNHVDTRDELREYDQRLFKLIDEVFRNNPWKYSRPESRSELPHLRGLDRKALKPFAWPTDLPPLSKQPK